MNLPHVILTTVWPMPHIGGVCTHVMLLRNQLKAKGLSVSLETPAEAAIYVDPPPPGERSVSGQLKEVGLQLGRYLKLLCQERQSLIHAHDVTACYGALLAGVTAPIILTVHGYLADEYVAAGAVKAGSSDYVALLEMERFSYTRASAVISVDTRIAKHIQKISGRKAVVVPNAVDITEFDGIEQRMARQQLNLPLDMTVLLCPRRLTQKNGVRYAIEALSHLVSRTGVMLVIAGDGEQRLELEKLAQDLRVQDRCAFVGAIPHQKMPLYYAASDIVLIPSIHAAGVEEATSISALEGMASARPVVASAVGGLTEIISPEETGILLPPAEPAMLAQAIMRLLNNEPLRKKIATRARAYVEETFGPKQFVARIMNVYQTVEKTLDCKLHRICSPTLPRATKELDQVLENQTKELSQATNILKAKGLSVAFLAVHNRLTGGAKVFFEHANQLYRRGIATAILAHETRPDWMVIETPWIQVPEGTSLDTFRGLFDIAVGMFWTGIPELLRFDASVKVLLEQGDPSLFEPLLLPEQAQRILSTCYSAPVGMITVSHKLSALLEEQFGRKSIVIPNAVDHNLFRPAPKQKKDHFAVLLVGADEIPFKGIRDGLLALDHLRKKGYPIKVVQVSPSGRTLYNFDREMIVRPGPKHLATLYQNADAYLCCSWYEAFPLPPLEAMACGTPVVSTDNGGVREYAVPEENCLLAPAKDPIALANQLERLFLDESLRSRLRSNGIETAKRFTWDNASEAFAGALVRFCIPYFGKGTLKSVTGKIRRFHELANALVWDGQLEVAKEVLRTALTLDPNEPDSLYNLAYVSSLLGNKEFASQLLSRLLAANPFDSEALALHQHLR